MLRVLVTADELVRAAQPAGPSQGGSDSHAAGTTAGATGGGLHSLLRLQALRACVASEEAVRLEEALGPVAQIGVTEQPGLDELAKAFGRLLKGS